MSPKLSLRGQKNIAGKKIVAKVAAVVAVSGAVFVLSAASANAYPIAAGSSHDNQTYMSVSGVVNDWTANASWYNPCPECIKWHCSCGPRLIFRGHIQFIFPDGSYLNGEDSDDPKLPNTPGAGAGKITAIGWKLISPGEYQEVGKPFLYV